MTSVPTTASAASLQPRAGAPAQGAPLGALDPIKLFNKYKWVLLITGFIGAVLGVAAHLVLVRVYPVWKPIAILKCLSPQRASGEDILAPSAEEMAKFMATQAKMVSQDAVLSRLASNPALQSEATKWCKPFYVPDQASGRDVFDHIAALEELRDSVRARVIPQTYFIELSMSNRHKEDATTILRLVTDTYMKVIQDEGSSQSRDRIQAMLDSIKRSEEEIDTWRRKREQLIRDGKVTGTIAERNAAVIAELQGVNDELLSRATSVQQVKQEIEMMDERLKSPAGIVYPDEILEESERDPQVLDAVRSVQAYEQSKQGMLNQGYNPDHRLVKQVDAQLEAANQNLKDVRARVQRKLFDGKLDALRRTERSLDAQVKDLADKKNELSTKLTDLVRLQGQIDDANRRVEGLQQSIGLANQTLSELRSKNQLATANRVVVTQEAAVPTEMSFPKLTYMLPAGTILLTLLVGSIIVTRELIDQRVKGPADIGLIPRTRLLGWVPDAAEDPEDSGAMETAFRDRSRGVVAESFRQMRSSIFKRIQQAGHRTIVVVSGMPGSGATSVVANLALACAAAEQRVLVVDANLRRPALHRVFGVPEQPGLADVLARKVDCAHAAQRVADNLDVIVAGTKDQRVVERLAAESMNQFLAEVRSKYDIVLFDVAPAVVAGDGLSLAGRCDASILVVRAFGEKRGMVARMRNELMDTRGEFLGVIVNAVRASAGGYLRGNIRAATEYHRT